MLKTFCQYLTAIGNRMKSEKRKVEGRREREGGREIESRVVRWYIFKPKIPIWVNFTVSSNERCW
jgi:hypothetical protein